MSPARPMLLGIGPRSAPGVIPVREGTMELPSKAIGAGDDRSPTLEWVVPMVHALIGTEMTAGVCFRGEGSHLVVQAARTINVADSRDFMQRFHARVQSLQDGRAGQGARDP